MKYRKKPVVINAITFDEFVEYGKTHGGNIVNGMPWSFEYNGHPVTHGNDTCYLIPTLEGDFHFIHQPFHKFFQIYLFCKDKFHH